MIIASNAWNEACGTGPKGFKCWKPKAHNDNGISIKKTVVIAREMWDRTSSHSGLEASPGEGQSGERKVYPRSIRTHAASMAI